MPSASQVLGKFAADLRFDDIPAAVVERAKDCIIDTVAAGRVFGLDAHQLANALGIAGSLSSGLLAFTGPSMAQ